MRKLLLAAGLAAVVASPAWSGEYLDWGNWLSSGNAVKPATPKAFRTNIAAGAGIAPEYLGGDQYELKPLLLADVEYRGEFFLSTQRGLGWAFYKKGNIRFGPRLTVDYGRDSGGSDALEGLPDVDPAIEVGLFGEFYNGPFRLMLSVAQDIGNNNAWAPSRSARTVICTWASATAEGPTTRSTGPRTPARCAARS